MMNQQVILHKEKKNYLKYLIEAIVRPAEFEVSIG